MFQQRPLLYILQEQGHFLHLATIAVALVANKHSIYVLRGSVQASEAPPSEDMAAIFPNATVFVYLQFL